MRRYGKRGRRNAGRARLPLNRWRSRLNGLLVMALLAVAASWLDARTDRPANRQPAKRSAAQSVYVLEGRVSKVSDGDTVTLSTVDGRQRIRLASIDAPETGSRGRPGQPYGDASRQYLTQMVSARTITARCYEQDHYQRHVCDLMLADGQTANRRLVEAGMAWANQQGKGKYLRDKQMLELERQARQAKRGLWQAAKGKPASPWEWRYQCWQKRHCK